VGDRRRFDLVRGHSRRPQTGSRLAGLAALALGWLVGCATTRTATSIPRGQVVWNDPDRRPFEVAPGERPLPGAWAIVDRSVFLPMTRALSVPAPEEATNVNALDEVPNSSWFHNRWRTPRSAGEVARGACSGRPEPELPLTVFRAKAEGVSPGFFVRDAAGREYLAKVDRPTQPYQETAAEVVGSALHHAVGYHVPCNRVRHVAREELVLGEEAALDPAELDGLLVGVTRGSDGRLRMMLSELIEGEVLGPWRFQGTDEEDPNDVVDHEDRRDVRAMHVMAAWIHRYDAKTRNTMRVFVDADDDGDGFVRHYLLDFADALGRMPETAGLAERLGHRPFFDLGAALGDFVTLGIRPVPWSGEGTAHEVFGYFDGQLDPESYRVAAPNVAFLAKTDADAAWMARLIARIPEGTLAAVVERARLRDADARWLSEALRERRDAILERHLFERSSLEVPRRVGGTLRLRDLAVGCGLVSAESRRDEVRTYRRAGDQLVPVTAPNVTRRGAEVVVDLEPGIDVIDIASYSWRGRERRGVLRVHLHEGRVVRLQRGIR